MWDIHVYKLFILHKKDGIEITAYIYFWHANGEYYKREVNNCLYSILKCGSWQKRNDMHFTISDHLQSKITLLQKNCNWTIHLLIKIALKIYHVLIFIKKITKKITIYIRPCIDYMYFFKKRERLFLENKLDNTQSSPE
jgi:hypothetical protein